MISKIIEQINAHITGSKLESVSLVGDEIVVRTDAGEFSFRLAPDQTGAAAAGWKGR